MKIKLLIFIAAMLVSFSSTSITHWAEQQLEESNNIGNVAFAQSASEGNEMEKLKSIQLRAATVSSLASNERAEVEQSIVSIISCWEVRYQNEEELYESADLVVKGFVVKELGSTFVKGKYSEYTTEVMFQIDKVYKGDIEVGDEIIVSQMGGFDGNVQVISENTTYLSEYQEAVLFLRKHSDGKYRSINESEGIYVLEDGFYINKGSNKVLSKEYRE